MEQTKQEMSADIIRITTDVTCIKILQNRIIAGRILTFLSLILLKPRYFIDYQESEELCTYFNRLRRKATN